MIRRLALLALIVTTLGCGPRRVQVASVAPTPAPGGGQCQSTLSVGVVQTRAGCEIDERVSGQTATLLHACGDGPASATFADARFEGGVTNGELDLSIETTFDFTDGCRWRTKQRIVGPLASGQLAYRYEEQPDPGQRGCAAGCVADATVQVY